MSFSLFLTIHHCENVEKLSFHEYYSNTILDDSHAPG